MCTNHSSSTATGVDDGELHEMCSDSQDAQPRRNRTRSGRGDAARVGCSRCEDSRPPRRLTLVEGHPTSHWERVLEWSGTLTDLAGAAALAGWDRETLMPAAGSEARAPSWARWPPAPPRIGA